MLRVIASATLITLALTTSAFAADISAASHLGYGVNGQSTTGFGGVAGSLVFLDLATPLGGDRYDAGLRTLAQGGRSQDGEFYRFGVGPLISARIGTQWSAQLSAQAFNETGLDADGEKAYRSRGHILMLGWERIFPVTSRVDIAWGGFLARHQGSFDPAAHLGGLPSSEPSRYDGVDSNTGLSRGIEIGIRLRR